MSSKFEKFVSESVGLHKEALAEQIRMSEDIDKYSMWWIGLSTAGIAVLIAQFETIAKESWLNQSFIGFLLVINGLLFVFSVFLGAWHQRDSIIERNCYRILISHFNAQKLIPYFNIEGFPTEDIPKDMHNRISDGQLLNFEKISDFEGTKKQAKKLRDKLTLMLNTHQLLAGLGYLLLFIFSIPA